MTTRRTLLQGAAALVAPAPWSALQKQLADMGESKLLDLLLTWRRLDEEFMRSMGRLEHAEQDARARGVRWDDCPTIAAIRKADNVRLQAMTGAIRRAARMPARDLADILLKLVFWRLSDVGPDVFANPCDMLSFSAYRDLLALTGWEALSHPADEKALAILRDDDAFVVE